MKRLASGGVDAEMERYWTEYYGEYGEQLVRELKTRVASLVRDRYRLSEDAEVEWYPTAQARTASAQGDVALFEGIALAKRPDGQTQSAILSLSYDATGKLAASKIV